MDQSLALQWWRHLTKKNDQPDQLPRKLRYFNRIVGFLESWLYLRSFHDPGITASLALPTDGQIKTNGRA
ncbi:MAG: hypothetical protein ACRESP_07445, partial [Pseudomonas sp.]